MSDDIMVVMDMRVETESNGAYAVVGAIGVINVRDTRRPGREPAMVAAYWLIGRHIPEFEQSGRGYRE